MSISFQGCTEKKKHNKRHQDCYKSNVRLYIKENENKENFECKLQDDRDKFECNKSLEA